MIVRTYKNGNITVKHEAGYDAAPSTFQKFIADVLENDDVNACKVLDFENWGNAYAVAPFWANVNGTTGVYYVGPLDFEAYRAGRTVRLVRDRIAPAFILPTYYKYQEATRRDGVRGCIYTLCDALDQETADEMRAADCDVLTSACEYAPEIRHAAVFVPDGITFEFC